MENAHDSSPIATVTSNDTADVTDISHIDKHVTFHSQDPVDPLNASTPIELFNYNKPLPTIKKKKSFVQRMLNEEDSSAFSGLNRKFTLQRYKSMGKKNAQVMKQPEITSTQTLSEELIDITDALLELNVTDNNQPEPSQHEDNKLTWKKKVTGTLKSIKSMSKSPNTSSSPA